MDSVKLTYDDLVFIQQQIDKHNAKLQEEIEKQQLQYKESREQLHSLLKRQKIEETIQKGIKEKSEELERIKRQTIQNDMSIDYHYHTFFKDQKHI